MEIAYENLNLIPQMLQLIKKQGAEIVKLNELVVPKTDLTKLVNVAKYLNVTKKTIYNYIDDGRFKQNIHYKKNIHPSSVKIVFIESAIEKFKKDRL